MSANFGQLRRRRLRRCGFQTSKHVRHASEQQILIVGRSVSTISVPCINHRVPVGGLYPFFGTKQLMVLGKRENKIISLKKGYIWDYGQQNIARKYLFSHTHQFHLSNMAKKYQRPTASSSTEISPLQYAAHITFTYIIDGYHHSQSDYN